MAQEICPICRSGIRQDSDHCTVCGYEKSIDFLRYRTLQKSRDEDLLEWEICARRAEMKGLSPAPIPGRKPKREELRQAAAPAVIPAFSPVEDFKYEITDDGVKITKYVGRDTEVSIPSTIEGKPVTAIGAESFSGCGSLSKITIPAGVTYIGDDVFYFTVSGNVISIGVGAFYGCSSLSEIRVASGNPTFCSVDGVLFSKNGKEIRAYPGGRAGAYTIPTGVTAVGNAAFSGCSGLSEITIPAGVTAIGYHAFTGCSSLSGIRVASDNPAFCSVDGVLFSKNGKEIRAYPGGRAGTYTIPAGVTSIGNAAFCGCSGLSGITIPAGVTTIGDDAFCGCSSLSELTIPAGVTTIGNEAFCGCSGLSELTIPAGVTSIENGAFMGCGNLSEIAIPSGVTSIGNSTFYGCRSLRKMTIPDSVTCIGHHAFFRCSSLSEITIPAGVTSVRWCAFSGCSSLTKITIPVSAKSIEDVAFNGCSSLRDVYYGGTKSQWNAIRTGKQNDPLISAVLHVTTPPDHSPRPAQTAVLAASPVENFEYEITDGGVKITKYIGKDTEVSIPSTIEGKQVTVIGDAAFARCGSLTKIVIPASVVSIGDSAFAGCDSLPEIMIPDSVTSIREGAFFGCSRLSRITIPTSVTSISGAVFAECDNLTEITIPASVMSIGDSAFFGCSRLSKITIPDSVKSIGGAAFAGCGRLTEITIPAGITSIRDSAFFGCGQLSKITIPASVMSIEDVAFNGCVSLRDVYYGGTKSQWKAIRTGKQNAPLTNATLHVTTSSRQRSPWPIIIVLAAAAVLIFLLAQKGMLQWPVQTAAQTGDKNIIVVVVHKDESKKEFQINTSAETLRAACEEQKLIAGDESEYGLYVKTVDGETADDGAQEWWCLTKDGEMVMTGVDDTMIADGEQYEFIFTVGW